VRRKAGIGERKEEVYSSKLVVHDQNWFLVPSLNLPEQRISADLIRSLLISRIDCSATSARTCRTAHRTVPNRVLFSRYVVSKRLSCVLTAY
jgi:hypothetical protein